MKGEGFMTYSAASQQGAIQMFCLNSWGAVLLSICVLQIFDLMMVSNVRKISNIYIQFLKLIASFVWLLFDDGQAEYSWFIRAFQLLPAAPTNKIKSRKQKQLVKKRLDCSVGEN